VQDAFSAAAVSIMSPLWFLLYSLIFEVVQDPNFWQSVRIIDQALIAFSQTLPYIRNTGEMGEMSAVDGTPINLYLIMPHTLVHATTIQLHWPLAAENDTSYQKCLFAAQEIMDVIHSIIDCDFSFLELVLGVCWACFFSLKLKVNIAFCSQNCWVGDAAEVLLREAARLRRSGDMRSAGAFDIELDTLSQALQRLSQIYPILSASPSLASTSYL
jgi:hypothetical protein